MAYRGIDAAERKNTHGPATDLSRWSLKVFEGQQVWVYLEEGEAHDNVVASRYHVGLGIEEHAPDFSPPTSAEDSFRNGMKFFSRLQTDDGHWAGDYGGPMFLLPGYAIVHHICGVTVPEENRREIVRYLSNLQAEDGGWGIHIESQSTVFGTTLNYVVMRLFGVPRDDLRMVKARGWLETRGGCLGIPSWGKFWLATLGVFSWDGCNSLFPEMVLLPQWFPLHTRRLWSYCRTVYMSMSYISGQRFTGPMSDVVRDLREELIFQPFDSVDWAAARNRIAEEDLYTPHTRLLDLFYTVCNAYERVAPTWLRKTALEWVYKCGVTKEDEFSNYIDIGPVNKMINMLAVFVHEGKDSHAFRQHVARCKDYMWMGRDGMKMNGTNGSQLWDTAFLVQGLIETSMRDEFKGVFDKANEYIDVSQIRHNHEDHKRYYRDETKGGWPFSTRAMGWIVADCTGEGLKAAIICKKHNYTDKPLSDQRIFDAVNILLLMQNETGGYATCEKTRGWHFMEWFNASEVFGEIMIDYDYVECTGSSVSALALFREYYPEHRADEVAAAIERGIRYMLSIQRPDGSWEGQWGVCFTYGTWFGVDGLVECGLVPSHPAIQRACDFLASKQQEDGGWGETFMSCVTREYVQHPKSQVVNTAWAVLSLLKGKYSDQDVIRRGVQLLMDRQLANGDWEQESISGVFNKNAMISYSNFKNIFPLWALARYTEAYPDDPHLKR